MQGRSAAHHHWEVPILINFNPPSEKAIQHCNGTLFPHECVMQCQALFNLGAVLDQDVDDDRVAESSGVL